MQKALGAAPNFMKVLASSPGALAGFLGLEGSLRKGALDVATRERIALALAESNGCQYCVSAHTALAGKAGLAKDEIEAARLGGSADPKADAAVKFARAVHEHKGEVTTAELDAVRAAGLDDGEIVEIIAHVGLNVLTNYVGKVGRVDIDFPEVELFRAA